MVRQLESGAERRGMRQRLWEGLDLRQRRACVAVTSADTEAVNTLLEMLREWGTWDRAARGAERENEEEEAKQDLGFFALALTPVLESGQVKTWELGVRRHVLLCPDLPTQLSAKGREQLNKSTLASANSMQGVAVRVRQEVTRDTASPAASRKGCAQIVAALFLALELKWVDAAEALLVRKSQQSAARRKRTAAKRGRGGTSETPSATQESEATRAWSALLEEERREMLVLAELDPQPQRVETDEEEGTEESGDTLPSSSPGASSSHDDARTGDNAGPSLQEIEPRLSALAPCTEHVVIARTFVHVVVCSPASGVPRAASLPARGGSSSTEEDAAVCECGGLLRHPGWTQCGREQRA